MGLNDTPAGERTHIVFFGRRNAGKSSLVNAVAGQYVAVVSDAPGTTTDPVRKAMELLPAGPVLLVDTPGIDDAGALGKLRVERTQAALDETDVAVLVIEAHRGCGAFERGLIDQFRERGIPYVMALSKIDALDSTQGGSTVIGEEGGRHCRGVIRVSARTGEGVDDLKSAISVVAASSKDERRIVGDLLEPGDVVVLVIPLDSAAPKGRLILPQQQVMRDVLSANAFPCATGVAMLPVLLDVLSASPRLVVTDSQVFEEVVELVPPDVPLTSFSILMARYKGSLPSQIEGIRAIEELKTGDRVLVAEGCSHHRQCEDIGTVKLPQWIREISCSEPCFDFASGKDFPRDLSPYSAVVHCGGCMLSSREMGSRIGRARAQQVPVANYGMVIARACGALERALEPVADAPNGLRVREDTRN